MDKLLPQFLSFPPHPPPPHPLTDRQYDEGIRDHIEATKKVTDKQLLQHTSGGEHPLSVINPAINTVPYIFILQANYVAWKKGDKNVDSEDLWNKMDNFLRSFDGRQIRYLGHELNKIFDAAFEMARRAQSPQIVIPPIQEALSRLDPSGTVLTSTHLALVKLALDIGDYASATDLVDKPVLYFPATTNVQSKPKYICELGLASSSYVTLASNLTLKMKYQDILEYFFNCGLICIGLRKWETAFEYLEDAITYPIKDNAVSKIMVEAYKRWVIVGLLLTGRPTPLPQTTPIAASKAYHTVAKPYETIVAIFESSTAARLKAEVEFGQKLWQEDCTTGLMLHVLAAYQKFQIRNLANIYTKVSIPEITNITMSAETGARVSIPIVENLIQTMLQEGSLHATITQSPNNGPVVLNFSPLGPLLSEADMQTELLTSTQRIQALAQEVKKTDRILSHDSRYISSVQKARKTSKLVTGSGQLGGAGGLDMEWNQMVDDEDIMGAEMY